MNEADTSLLAEVIACRHAVEDFANRYDEACAEYYQTGKTEFTNLTAAEYKEITNHCEVVLSGLRAVIPDAMSRWQSITFPDDHGVPWIEKTRGVWVRRRNLFRSLENNLRARHSLANPHKPHDEAATATILFVAADPSDATRLRLGEEFREIEDSLRKARIRTFVLAPPRLSVRPSDLSQAIHDESPRIIHFSGHGTSSGELCFEDAVGNVQAVPAEALAALFQLVSAPVDCVLLNACYSATQAQEIAKYVNYVIGMNKAIGDRAAIAFAIGFYQALGAGRTIQDAYQFGCVQIRLQGIPEHFTPVLMQKE
jgi:CHAT domain